MSYITFGDMDWIVCPPLRRPTAAELGMVPTMIKLFKLDHDWWLGWPEDLDAPWPG